MNSKYHCKTDKKIESNKLTMCYQNKKQNKTKQKMGKNYQNNKKINESIVGNKKEVQICTSLPSNS